MKPVNCRRPASSTRASIWKVSSSPRKPASAAFSNSSVIGACLTHDAPTAAAPHRQISEIVSLPYYPLCSRHDSTKLPHGGRPRDGAHESDRLLGRHLQEK